MTSVLLYKSCNERVESWRSSIIHRWPCAFDITLKSTSCPLPPSRIYLSDDTPSPFRLHPSPIGKINLAPLPRPPPLYRYIYFLLLPKTFGSLDTLADKFAQIIAATAIQGERLDLLLVPVISKRSITDLHVWRRVVSQGVLRFLRGHDDELFSVVSAWSVLGWLNASALHDLLF